jgi:hypothetical protein
MPDLTTAIRAAVEAKCIDTAAKATASAGKTVAIFDALKHENTERWQTGLKHHTGVSVDGRPQFTSDHSIGAMHWRDKAGVWQPVNTDWAVGGDGWSDVNETSQARILVDTKGTRRVYPDQHGDAYIEFGAPEYWDGEKWQPLEVPEQQSAKAVAAETATWTADHWRVEVVNTGSQSKLAYVMLDERAPSRVRWPYTCYACSLDEAGNLTGEKGDVIATVYQGRAEDADGAEVPVKTLMDKEAVEYVVDAGKAAWPMTLDPTLDYQVGAGGNDTYRYGASGFTSSNAEGRVGQVSGSLRHQSILFSSVSGLGGATVSVSYVTMRGNNGGASAPATKVYLNKTGSPTAPTTAAGFDALALTSSGADWDTADRFNQWDNSPSLNDPFAELVGAVTPTAIQVVHRDDGSSNNTLQAWIHYDGNASYAPKLHVEYTAASTGFKHFMSLLGVGR